MPIIGVAELGIGLMQSPAPKNRVPKDAGD